MLENQNLELGDVDISDRSKADSHSMKEAFAHVQDSDAESGSGPELDSGTEEQSVTHVLHSDALLDAYA